MLKGLCIVLGSKAWEVFVLIVPYNDVDIASSKAMVHIKGYVQLYGIVHGLFY